MAPNFSKDAIVSGLVDFYCLACKSQFYNENEAKDHIVGDLHKNNFKKTSYEVSSEFIRKIHQWYLCELCNLIIKTKAKVKLHVKDQKHISAKLQNVIKRMEAGITINDIAVNDKSWNSISDGTCIVCNTDYRDENEHLKDPVHIVNIIESKVTVWGNNNVYRLIDETSFHCIICNLLVDLEAINKHFEEEAHKKAYKKHKIINNNSSTLNVKEVIEDKTTKNTSANVKSPNIEEMDNLIVDTLEPKQDLTKVESGKTLCHLKIDDNNVASHISGEHHNSLHKIRIQKLKNETLHDARNEKDELANILKIKTIENENNVTDEKNDNNTKILDSLSNFESNGININFVSDCAVCKKCSETIDLNFDIIEKHITEHKESKNKNKKSATLSFNTKANVKVQPDKISPKCNDIKTNKEMEVFAKANNFNIIVNQKKVVCRKCKTHVPFTLQNMVEHVNGWLHKNNNDMPNREKRKPENLEKILTENFIQTADIFINGIFHDVVINEKICISIASFGLVLKTKQKNISKCILCNIQLNESEIMSHSHYEAHDHLLAELPIVTNISSEFIREIRSGKFHCGYCNVIFPCWEKIEAHLQTVEHRQNKTAADWRLHLALPQITANGFKREVQERLLYSWFTKK